MQQVIQETAAQVIVTDQATRRHGWTLEQSTCDIPVMVVDFNSLPTQERETNPDVVVDAQQLAYVMYTSGSTGAPKGVAITHRDVTSLAFDRVWQGGNQKKTLLHSPHAFDASTYELWVPLLNGHQIIMAPPGTLEIRTGKSDHSEESHQPLAHSGIVPPHG
jgi:non-ribosomal peptide synthetase component F